MAPTGRVIAWFETETGEIISDSISFHIADMFKNKVNLGFLGETLFLLIIIIIIITTIIIIMIIMEFIYRG